MKKLLIALAAVAITASSYGQGAFVFVNRVSGVFDVPVYVDGLDQVGAGSLGPVTANLYQGDTLLGSTTFRSTTGVTSAYLLPVDIIIDGNTGQEITARIEFVLGGSVINSTGDFDFTVTPTVPPNPPANIGGYDGGLGGPEGIGTLTVVPEPTTIALGLLGAGALLLRRRRK